MKKLISVLLTLHLFLTFTKSQTTDAWVRLAPPGGGFVVMVPGQAEEQNFNKPEVFSSKIYTVVVKEGSQPRALYLAGFGDYAPTVKLDPQTELNLNRDNFIKEMQGMKLLQSRSITLDSRLGIEFTGESNQAKVTCKFYIRGNRVFQLAVMVFTGADEARNVNMFFDSFAFTD